jgi:ABC-2 type transport system permease protein
MRPNPFRKYHGFIKGSFLNFVAFRTEILGWVLQDIITLFIMVFLWFAIYKESSNETINGFTYPQMMMYLVTASLSAQWIANGTTFQEIGQDISQGNIATSLTRPVSYRGQKFATSLGSVLGNFLIFFLPMALIAFLIFTFGLGQPAPTWYNMLLYLVAGFLAIVILDSFDFMVAQLGFLTNSLFGIFLIKSCIITFLSGAAIPFSFFPSWAQPVLECLPFSGLASTPINILLGRYDWATTGIRLGVSLAYAILLYLLSELTNVLMVRHVESAGG